MSSCILIVTLITIALAPIWIYTSISSGIINKPLASSTNYTLNNPDGFDPSTFKGYLTACSSGCSGTFKEEQSDWCNIKNGYPEESYESLCNTFNSLYNGSLAYSLLFILSIISLIIFSCCTGCRAFRSQVQPFNFSILANLFIFAALTFVFFLLAFIIWNVETQASYNGDCSKFPSDGNEISVCASVGPKLVIGFISVATVYLGMLIVVFCFAYYGRVNRPSPQAHRRENDAVISREILQVAEYPQRSFIQAENYPEFQRIFVNGTAPLALVIMPESEAQMVNLYEKPLTFSPNSEK